MIEIEIPSFFSVRAPRYSFDGGQKICAFRLFPPLIKTELYNLISENPESKKFADIFNRFVIITLIAILCSGFAATFSTFTYLNYRSRIFFSPTILLLVMSLISNFMSWFYFRRMSETYMAYVQDKRQTGINFEHFEINDNGIFKREIGNKKTDLI